jgi:hypothetical protein
MVTAAVASANPFSDRYAEPSAQLNKTADSSVFFNANNGNESSGDGIAVVAKIQHTVLNDPDVHYVPGLNWSPPSSHSSHASVSSLGDASTAPTSPVSDADNHDDDNDMTDCIVWNNDNLMYLVSILKPNELTANTLTFNPPLEVLQDLTYPFHLRLHAKSVSVPHTLIAQSTRGCLSPDLARRSLAHAMLSDHSLIDAAIARYNALCAIHSTAVPTLTSILRGMTAMILVTDDEWTERRDQLCGFVPGEDEPGQCVDGECSVEMRLEYYFLLTGRIVLEEWIRCVGICVGMNDGERVARAETYGEAGRFLGRAFEELVG